MITPQLTEQYGHVDRVSLARAIFSTRNCANAGFTSKPKTAAATPPTAPTLRKSRRVGCIKPPSRQGTTFALQIDSTLGTGLQALTLCGYPHLCVDAAGRTSVSENYAAAPEAAGGTSVSVMF